MTPMYMYNSAVTA